ncbi:beta-galactosidase [Planctomycetota bacterium]
MRYFFAVCLVIICTSLCMAEDPTWPAPGSKYPEGAEPPRPEVSNVRLGTDWWKSPPKVISPYAPSNYDYQTIVWGSDKRIGQKPLLFKMLKKMYVLGTMVYSQANPKPTADAGMPFYNTCITNLLYIRNKSGSATRKAFFADRTRKNAVRKPSLEDPKTDKDEQNRARRVAERCSQHKPLAYDLRDEATYVVSSACPIDFDFSDVSMKHFRKWLKIKHKTLEALNKEWETDFASWDAVFPFMTEEIQKRVYNNMAQANLAPWADHREYNDDTFISAIARYRDVVLKVDPGAPVGISGTQMPSTWGGFDYWKLCTATSWIEHYECNGSKEIHRSFFKKGTPSIAASGYKGGLDAGLMKTWYLLFHGDTGQLVWPYGKNYGQYLMFDVQGDRVDLTKHGKTLKEIFKEARNGIPCLIMHADMEVNRIGILNSQPSLRADWVFEVKRDGSTWVKRYSSYEGSHNFAAAGREGFYKAVEDVGFQYTVIDRRQVEAGELVSRGIKLFIVSRGIAMSKKEIEGYRKFVEQGGVLVTDLMAGSMNENCRVWPDGPSPIDSLLGLKRAPFDIEIEKKGEKSRGYEGGFGNTIKVAMKKDFRNIKQGETLTMHGYQEIKLKAGTAIPLAETPRGPAILEHKVGKGYAYTMNFDIPNYLSQRGAENAPEKTKDTRRLIKAFAEKAGCRPLVKVTREDTKQYPFGLETFVYRQGEARYFAVNLNKVTQINWQDLSDTGIDVKDQAGNTISFKIPWKGYVTEMRTGKSHGLTDSLKMVMPKKRPLVFSVLPYEVKGLKADIGNGKIIDNKLAVSVSIETNGKIGDHVVHAELLDEKGEPIPESVVNLPLPGGIYKGSIDYSYVEEKGPFTLNLRDVASGKSIKLNVNRK